MKTAFKILSFVALLGTVLLALGFFTDRLTLASMQTGMLVCTLLWFGTASFWMETHL
jgi:hypothetical protein